MIDAAEELARRVRARVRRDHTTTVAIAGAVAIGKSTLAAGTSDVLTAAGVTVEIVSTDGFLLPGAELARRDLVMRKGFPESYDVARLRGFLRAVRAGARDLTVPVYSHATYDLVPGERRTVPRCQVLVLEGVNALSATVGFIDLGVYVHAADEVVESWYVGRFRELCATAPEASFYAQFSGTDAETLDRLARHVWHSINLVNLREHIGPSRRYADVVVEKGPDHGVGAIHDVARP